MVKEKTSKTHGQAFSSVSITPEDVVNILKKSKIPNFSVNQEILNPMKLEFCLDITRRLNDVVATYSIFTHVGSVSGISDIRKNLDELKKMSERYNEILSKLSTPAKILFSHPFSDQNFLDSIKHNILGLQIQTDKAIQILAKLKSGRPKEHTYIAITQLANIYQDVTNRVPGINVVKGKSGGPFFRFVSAFFNFVDNSFNKSDETLIKNIQSALKLIETNKAR